MKPIPIFVISYNRGAMLQRAVDSYLRLSDAVEVIVHDNGSDDPATLESLHALHSAGITVVRAPKIHEQVQLNSVNATVRTHFGDVSNGRYVVTDCDIDMSIADPDALAIYGELLDRFPATACAGPMLRIRDIPRDYPLFNHVMNRHIEQFWGQAPQWIETSSGPTAILPAPFDTTFALHRAGEDFRRLKDGIRVYHPYEALHLDWYLTAEDPPTDAYGHTSSERISHWSNDARRKRHGQAALRHKHLIYVDREEGGGLIARGLEL
jgi:hypothetical protein